MQLALSLVCFELGVLPGFVRVLSRTYEKCLRTSAVDMLEGSCHFDTFCAIGRCRSVGSLWINHGVPCMGFVGLLCDLPCSRPSLEVELPSCGKPGLLNVFFTFVGYAYKMITMLVTM